MKRIINIKVKNRNIILHSILITLILFSVNIVNVSATTGSNSNNTCVLNIIIVNGIFDRVWNGELPKLYINGVYKGQFKFRLFSKSKRRVEIPIPQGERMIRVLVEVKKEGYMSYGNRYYYCSAGEEKNIRILLREAFCYVNLNIKDENGRRIKSKIYINGKLFRNGRKYYRRKLKLPLLNSGEVYEITAIAEGYKPGRVTTECRSTFFPYEKTITLQKEINYCTLKIYVKNSRTKRGIKSTKITINGLLDGYYSYKSQRRPPGTYEIVAEKPGYLTQTKIVQCPAGTVKNVIFNLIENSCRICVRNYEERYNPHMINRLSAKILVNGVRKYKLESYKCFRYPSSATSITIRAERNGYFPDEKTISCNPGERNDVNLYLHKKYCSVKIHVKDSRERYRRAHIYVDNVHIGEPNRMYYRLNYNYRLEIPTQKTITFKAVNERYGTAEKQITCIPGGREEITLRF